MLSVVEEQLGTVVEVFDSGANGTCVMKRSVRHDRTSYNKEMLLKLKVIDGINGSQWKSLIHTFL